MDTWHDDVRPAALAGQFYPATAGPLAAAVSGHLAAAAPGLPSVKALIAPHAGYVYSGDIAGSAWAPLAGREDVVRRVVLLGPAHRVAFRGMALSSARAFATPVADVPVDRAAIDSIRALPGVAVMDRAHADEHSLEVHLPFLHRLFPRAAVVPVVVGEAAPEDVDAVLAALWGGPETVIVISSDLSHFSDYEAARVLDGEAARAIETLDPDALEDGHACGRHPVRGLLARARALDLRATTVDLRNSGDTAGPRDRVVGYGAWLFQEAAAARLPGDCRDLLGLVARKAIHRGLSGAAPAAPAAPATPREDDFPWPLRNARAAFVTLHLDGVLRGCIGSAAPHRSLVADVADNAWRAAFADPRFPPLTEDEAGRLEIGISVLGARRPLAFTDAAGLAAALRPHEDGVLLRSKGHSGLFLPQVWESLPAPGDFLAHLMDKAGLPDSPLPADLRAWRFSTESF